MSAKKLTFQESTNKIQLSMNLFVDLWSYMSVDIRAVVQICVNQSKHGMMSRGFPGSCNTDLAAISKQVINSKSFPKLGYF